MSREDSRRGHGFVPGSLCSLFLMLAFLSQISSSACASAPNHSTGSTKRAIVTGAILGAGIATMVTAVVLNREVDATLRGNLDADWETQESREVTIEHSYDTLFYIGVGTTIAGCVLLTTGEPWKSYHPDRIYGERPSIVPYFALSKTTPGSLRLGVRVLF